MAKDKPGQGFGVNFKHPIFQSWGSLIPEGVELIFAKEDKVYTEHSVRGDWVGYETKEIDGLAQSFTPSVWALELAYGNPYWSIVFAPADFDISRFHHDLSALFYLGTMTKFVNRSGTLENWELPANLLSPGMSWGEAQGWWHKDHNIVVVCLIREGAHDLWKYLNKTFSITKGQTVEIRDPSVNDAGLLKAMELLQSDIRHHPRR